MVGLLLDLNRDIDMGDDDEPGKGIAGPLVVFTHPKLSSSLVMIDRKLNIMRDVAMEVVVRMILCIRHLNK